MCILHIIFLFLKFIHINLLFLIHLLKQLFILIHLLELIILRNCMRAIDFLVIIYCSFINKSHVPLRSLVTHILVLIRIIWVKLLLVLVCFLVLVIGIIVIILPYISVFLILLDKFHFINWYSTFAIYPFALDDMLILHLHYSGYGTNICICYKTESSRFLCLLIFQYYAIF